VKHAGAATLQRIDRLLKELRARDLLREVSPGRFTLKSRAFLHFHDDPAGVFADVRFADDFVRMRVSTAAEQAELIGRIDECLDAVGVRGRRDRPARGGER
jgi:hypothetical protein